MTDFGGLVIQLCPIFAAPLFVVALVGLFARWAIDFIHTVV